MVGDNVEDTVSPGFESVSNGLSMVCISLLARLLDAGLPKPMGTATGRRMTRTGTMSLFLSSMANAAALSGGNSLGRKVNERAALLASASLVVIPSLVRSLLMNKISNLMVTVLSMTLQM